MKNVILLAISSAGELLSETARISRVVAVGLARQERVVRLIEMNPHEHWMTGRVAQFVGDLMGHQRGWLSLDGIRAGSVMPAGARWSSKRLSSIRERESPGFRRRSRKGLVAARGQQIGVETSRPGGGSGRANEHLCVPGKVRTHSDISDSQVSSRPERSIDRNATRP